MPMYHAPNLATTSAHPQSRYLCGVQTGGWIKHAHETTEPTHTSRRLAFHRQACSWCALCACLCVRRCMYVHPPLCFGVRDFCNRPTMTSATLSRFAESELAELVRRVSAASRPAQMGCVSSFSREATQFRLPCRVLISPVCVCVCVCVCVRACVCVCAVNTVLLGA